MPASSGSPSRSSDSDPNRRRMKLAIDSSPPFFRAGITRSIPVRSFPGQEKSELLRNGPIFMGTASAIPSGSGWSRPRWTTNTARSTGFVGTSRSPRPSSRQRRMPSGFSASSESGPPSRRKPSFSSVRMTPPQRSLASRRTNEAPFRARAWAAARPAIPPPTTATSTLRANGDEARGAGVDVLDDGLDVVDLSRGQDAVAEVEDVARPAPRPLEHVVHPRQEARARRQQERGIEVALHGRIFADPPPAL